MSKAKPSPDELPEVLGLFKAIADHHPTASGLKAQIVRCADIRFAKKKDFFSGEGAALFGGRWNRIGIRAIYGSLDVLTATTEALQNFLDFGIPKAAMRPTVIASARVSLAKVLELQDDLLDDAIGFSLSDLLAEDWAAIQAGGEESWSQAVGRGCKLAGFEAMIVPSARLTGGKNIVVFPDNLQKGSSIEIEHKDLLPD